MKSSELDLLPPPKSVRFFGEGRLSPRARVLRMIEPLERPERGAYALRVTADLITIQAADAVGQFYADQTLAQLRKQFGAALPCLQIVDWPDFPVRGFYHDVTRGKVPTLTTLLELAETCARYKLNHLELYIEHTYAFAAHPKVWAGADPLTADEIRTLDARCEELHIDLVPSFSTFGHFYTWIHNAFPHLNELERDCSGDPFNWWDRMMHYTLDCRDPRSLELVTEIIREVRPLFRSRYFNICCDETFDLGKGKNAKAAQRSSTGRLYVNFLKAIMNAVRECDAVPLFWGDIMGHHAKLQSEIPRDAVVLDWDYSPKLTATRAPELKAARRSYYICGGTQAWNRWLPRYDMAHANLTRYARHGLAHGAGGMLTTDWGDSGHINTLGPTLPLIALAGSVAWNARSPALARGRFEATASRALLGDESGELLSLLGELSAFARADWNAIARSWQPRSRNMPDDWFHAETGLYNDVFKRRSRAHETALRRIIRHTARVEKLMAKSRIDSLLAEEIHVGMLGLRVMEEVHLVYHQRIGRVLKRRLSSRAVADRVDDLDRRLARVWLRRNKPSELHRVRAVLKRVVDDLRSNKR